MPFYRVYRYRSRGRATTGVIRVWQGEASSETQAVSKAAAAQPGLASRMALFAREASEDQYFNHPNTIIEEN